MKKALTILLIIASFSLDAQDIQFSQFYAAPLFLNPAFAGSSEISRIGLNFRNQWPGLDRTFVSYSIYADHFFSDKNSGVGFIINGSRESITQLQNNDFGLLYSYRVKLGEESFLHLGIQGVYAIRNASFDEVVLGTQLDIDRGVILNRPGSVLPDERQRSYADLHSGIFYYNRKYWLGVSVHNITQPDLSYLAFDLDRLPRRIGVHGGVKFDLESGAINDFFNNTNQERTISFAFNYRRQGLFDQLDIGMEFYAEPLILGLWYRGLPTRTGLPNNESIIPMIGISLPTGLDLGYSFDFTVSKLGWRNTGGAHEISVRYSFMNQLWNQSQNKRLPTFKY